MALTHTDLREHVPAWALARPNRPCPSARIVRTEPDVTHDEASDTFTLEHLTRREARLIYDLTLGNSRLYGLNRELGERLGIDPDDAPDFVDEPIHVRIQRYLDGKEGQA